MSAGEVTARVGAGAGAGAGAGTAATSVAQQEAKIAQLEAEITDLRAQRVELTPKFNELYAAQQETRKAQQAAEKAADAARAHLKELQSQGADEDVIKAANEAIAEATTLLNRRQAEHREITKTSEHVGASISSIHESISSIHESVSTINKTLHVMRADISAKKAAAAKAIYAVGETVVELDDVAISFMPTNALAVQPGFRRLRRLCNMPLADMEATFKFERGQVWRLGDARQSFDIYIQEAYVEMLPLIESHVALEQQATMSTRCMVRGTPGIGKTRFAWARIVQYIMMIKAGVLAGMFLRLDEFSGHLIIVSQLGVGSEGLTENDSVWVYDLGAGFTEAGLTDTASHADISLSLDGAHLNGISKSGMQHMLHMPLVSMEEAKAIAKATLPELPDGFEKSLRLVGGTLREPLAMSFDELEKLVDQRIQQMSTEKLVHVLHVARGAEVLDTPSRRQVSPHTLVVADIPCWPTEEDRGQGVPRSRRFYEYRVHFCSAEVQERVMKKILEDKTPSFGEYISRHLQDADAGVNFETYGQWSMRHFDKCFHFGTRRDGLAILCPMIRLYPGRAQTASSEWVFFDPGQRQPVKYTWHRTMESSLYTVFQQDRGEGLEKYVFVPYSQVEAVMDLFLWQRGDCYLVQFTKSMTHRPCAERMLELIRSMNDVSPAALNPADIGIPDDWVIPNLVFAVPSQTVGSFKFQPFQCTTSMLTGDQRKELVATLTAKVKQFKIGVPLTTAAGVPVESKAEYDAAVSPTVLVPLDGIVAELDKYSGADLGNEARSKVGNNVRKLFQRLFNVGPGRSNQLLQWLSTAEGMDAVASASPGGDVSDGDTEMKGEEGEAEVDPLQRFLTEHPAVSFLDSFSDKHATWSIGMRALTARTPVQSGCKRARTR